VDVIAVVVIEGIIVCGVSAIAIVGVIIGFREVRRKDVIRRSYVIRPIDVIYGSVQPITSPYEPWVLSCGRSHQEA